MERTNTSRKRRRGRRKTRKVSPKASPGGPAGPDVGAESSEMLEELEVPALHAACLYSELSTIQGLLESRPDWINCSDAQGRQPLHMLLSSQRYSETHTCLRYLLEQGADVNAATDSGQTPLHLAVSRGLQDCAELLVKAGADILGKDRMGLTPLDMAHIWCHRKLARYLKHSLWHAEKKKEMEEIRLTQVLHRDLISMVKHQNLDKQTVISQKVDKWAKTKGFPLLKSFSPRAQVSKYHSDCILPKPTMTQLKGLQKNKCISTTQLETSSESPWFVYVGLQPQKLPLEPDLRESVMLRKDSSSRRLHYITKWSRAPHPTPNLPLEVIERVLFPRAFPSRITTPRDFEPQNIEKLQHRGFPLGRSSSPWTEVAMHLAEVLELGHY